MVYFLIPCVTLCNDEVYHECRDKTKPIHSKVFKQLLDIKKNSMGPKFKDQYIKLCSPGDNSPTARFYSLPKCHKANKLAINDNTEKMYIIEIFNHLHRADRSPIESDQERGSDFPQGCTYLTISINRFSRTVCLVTQAT